LASDSVREILAAVTSNSLLSGATRFSKKHVLVAGVVLLAGMQFVPVQRNNPSARPSQAIFAFHPMPESVRVAFERSCTQCHSNETRWPWYSHVAPFSWIVAHDVHEGRKEMNFSSWGMYSQEKREEKLTAICEQVTNGDMPESKYAFVHRNSRLSDEERDAICNWTESARGEVPPK
jgi:Haem-binding domain